MDIEVARGIIDAMPPHHVFTTADFIRARDGTFLSDLETPGGSSPNAQTGKFLSQNSVALGIEKVSCDEPITDDNDHRTKTARWRKRR